MLQRGVFDRFLEVSSERRQYMTSTELMQVITHDVHQVVHNGYIVLLKLFTLYCQLGFMMLYQLLLYKFYGHPEQDSYDVLVRMAPIFVMPICSLVFMSMRASRVRFNKNKLYGDSKRIMTIVNDTFANFDLIVAYFKKSVAADLFDACIKKYNKSFWQDLSVSVNNQYFANWLSMLLVAAWIYRGGEAVLKRGESLGVFLSNLQILQTFGACCVSIYKLQTELQSAVPSLIRITQYMNIDTDLVSRRVFVENFAQQTKAWRELATNQEDALDSIPIMFGNVDYKYTSKGWGRAS